MKYLVIDVAAESYGAMTILKEFYAYATSCKEDQWVFLLSDMYLEETDNVKILVDKRPKRNWAYRLYWEFTQMKKIVDSLRPDAIISLQNLIAFGCKSYPQLLYMHMPIPFQNTKKFSLLKSKERTCALYQGPLGDLIVKSIKKADLVVVQGQWLKEAICHRAKKDLRSKIIVSPTDVAIPENLLARYAQDEKVVCKQFFYPVAPSVFKNHECIFAAVDILAAKGVSDFKVLLTVDNEDQRYPQREQLVYLGRQTREKVLEYLCDSVLVFPSYIETFGLPMAEARALGCITLASDCPFSHEILDDYANADFFDPFRPEQLAAQMARILEGDVAYQYQPCPQREQVSWQTIMEEFRKRICHKQTRCPNKPVL